ncbi:hypothetical protein E3J68_02235 [Candidatus Aerophobetes bacterium]|uniref:Uncharacterized protein n=1 Tax=Aerophobetes bacterium TaxID=2030807 RepID=A0A523TGV3_UNCAE|nr:MAG: hypothetical protein E3J68_02235 [Candidatus Aerophobetes bacterium]
MVPLYGELHSQRADGFQSENKQILTAIDLVREVIGKKGIWSLDRGGDRGIIFKGVLVRELRFAIRLRGDRDLRDLPYPLEVRGKLLPITSLMLSAQEL